MPDDDNIMIDCLKTAARVTPGVCGTMPRCADCPNLPDGVVAPQQASPRQRLQMKLWMRSYQGSYREAIIAGGITRIRWASDTSGGWIRSCGK